MRIIRTSDVVDQVHARTGVKKSHCVKVVESALDVIAVELSHGRPVRMPRFGGAEITHASNGTVRLKVFRGSRLRRAMDIVKGGPGD